MTLDRRRIAFLAAVALLIATTWIIVGVFFASQAHFIASARGEPEDPDRRAVETAVGVIIWALLTPAVIGLAERLPVAAPHRWRNLLLLLVIGFVVATGRAAADACISAVFSGEATPEMFRRTLWFVFHTHFLFFIVITGAVNMLRLVRESQERERRQARAEAQLAQSQLRRLRTDLQPHFLFNTLNSVAALVHTDAAAAEQTIDSLIDLLRRSVDATERVEVAVAEELEFVQKYLQLQKLRFGPQLQSSVEVADEALLDALIPPLLLQPLVENSIVHGVRKRPRGGGEISVRVFVDETRLHLQVRDNGPGCDPKAPFLGDSIGVPNTAARLEHLYRDPNALTFRREEAEFVADIAIPLRLRA